MITGSVREFVYYCNTFVNSAAVDVIVNYLAELKQKSASYRVY